MVFHGDQALKSKKDFSNSGFLRLLLFQRISWKVFKTFPFGQA